MYNEDAGNFRNIIAIWDHTAKGKGSGAQTLFTAHFQNISWCIILLIGETGIFKNWACLTRSMDRMVAGFLWLARIRFVSDLTASSSRALYGIKFSCWSSNWAKGLQIWKGQVAILHQLCQLLKWGFPRPLFGLTIFVLYSKAWIKSWFKSLWWKKLLFFLILS